jgi:predicted TIM-barrel enzyme/transcriptional regulator with AAA-type ATPase domain
MPGTPRASSEILVGAAIGLGMTARAAAQGGADFLVALNAGRLRVMGAASNAAMLPICESNSFTDSFTRREILGRLSVPVYFGACVFDPALDIDRFLMELKAAGYAGVVNFPSAIHLDGAFGAAVEAAGLGFSREAALLGRAHAHGLQPLGYVKTPAQALALVEAGVDRICLNFGWNAGGTLGIGGAPGLEAAADQAARLFRRIRRAAPGTLCFVEGGPIISPADALKVCDASGADGYIGGSTLDRLPLEMSVMQTTSAFKTAPLLRAGLADEAHARARLSSIAGLAGQSEAMALVADRIARLIGTDLAILIAGEPGAGKTTAARAVHVAGRRAGPFRLFDAEDPSLPTQLFGAVDRGALDEADATVVIERIERLPGPLAARIGAWIERGVHDRFLARSEAPPRVRLVLTLTLGQPSPPEARRLESQLSASRIDLPPLRDRLEDVPLLVRAFLARRRGAVGVGPAQIAPGAMRRLIAHDWPGNVRELASLADKAVEAARGGVISERSVADLLAAESPLMAARGAVSEREWILDALSRHRFRRGETAAWLGLSRKTLYNKMRAYGIGG